MENLWTNGRLFAWSEASRRAALRLLGSAGLISLVGLSAEDAEAKKKHHKKKKKNNNNPSPPPPPPPPPPPDTTFSLVRSAAATTGNCLAGASGSVSIFKLGFAERMEVTIIGLPANTEFDLFVIQAPDAQFGASWYQGDLTTNGSGTATESFIGRFSIETFIVSPGAITPPHVHPTDATTGITTAPIHTFHVGVWFNKPADAQAAGCTNGATVTPFNGDHTAGIQALKSQPLGNGLGPLSAVLS